LVIALKYAVINTYNNRPSNNFESLIETGDSSAGGGTEI
jgi:hypothetical protein